MGLGVKALWIRSQMLVGLTTRQPHGSTCGDDCRLPMSSTDRQIAGASKEGIVQGYVARKGDRYYAVIYEGIDPLTGRERRRWHPAGTDQAVAETLACDLAARHRRGGGHERASLTVAVYLTQRWLPSKKMVLRPSTWDAYRRVIDLHLVPRVGRMPLRQLRPDHLERLYADLLDDGRADGTGGLSNKTVVEIHMILRRALDDAVRRGWILSNPAQVAHAPKRRPLSSNTSRVWNAQQLGHSWHRHAITATTPRYGSPPTPACDAARYSASDGVTSTSTPRTSP